MSMKSHDTRRSRGAIHVQALTFMLLAGIAPVASAQTTHTLPMVPPVSDAGIEGLVRIVNFSARAGTVTIHAIDDTGVRFGPVELEMGANDAVNFRSRHLEEGSAAKGLSGGVGDGEGNWRLELESDLSFGASAYIHTADGALPGMHETVPEAAGTWHVSFFNPASNMTKQSRLRLINPGTGAAAVTISARDDAGECAPGGAVSLTVPAGASRMLGADDLETGHDDLDGSFGDGTGKWRLFVTSSVPIEVMSLLRSSSGHLANVSAGPFDADADDCRQDPLPPPGTPFRDCPECPEMVVVPGGSFLMGSPESEPWHTSSEGPVHRVSIRSFAAGKYEVTFDEWEACVSDGGCGGYRPDDSGWGRGRRPVMIVSWPQAKEYAAWLTRKTGEAYRLLSESEWEYAARAGTTTPFHTGSTITTEQANYNGRLVYPFGDDENGLYRAQTLPVGSFAPNAFGLHDVHGNVMEWVEDCWNPTYEGAPTDGSAWTSGGCSWRALRGGSWYLLPESIRSAFRWGYPTSVQVNHLGFRIARTLTP